MKRRTLDLMFSTGGIMLALALLALGLVLTSKANFARDNVRDQLAVQDIKFQTVDKLVARETAFTEARTGCVIAFAGQQVTTGEQARCYADEYLGGHLTWLATRLKLTDVSFVDGMSYTKLGTALATLRTQVAAATTAKDPRLATLQKQLDDVTTVRARMFEGTMLKNALLTAYGFSTMGTTAESAATVSYIVAALLFLLSVAGYVHALFTPRTKTFAVPEAALGPGIGTQHPAAT